MTKDLLTQAAQKEADNEYWIEKSQFVEGMYQVRNANGDPILVVRPMEDADNVCDALIAAHAAAHVKCALLYSERAAGLVEAGKEMAKDLRLIAQHFDRPQCPHCGHLRSRAGEVHHAPNCVAPVLLTHTKSFDAALHAFNSQT